ncbi:MAG: hypothetical protein HY347_06770 [candidate division NC10 bacterium]|nr:hypothetical protein [candidate division NC10 bacterium]
MRSLLYVPIVHTMADMGSKAEALKDEYIKQYGEVRWSRSRQVIEEIWDGIRARLFAMDLDDHKLRVYQDGLPVCGREVEIAREVARKGSKNYALVLELVERGATLEGTEDPALLVEEYHYIASLARAKSQAEREAAEARYARESARILNERDFFISRRIDETLKEGETGVLFLGMLHQVDQLLPKDIRVNYLIHRLPFH